MHIPSNFSLEEALKFVTLPEIVLDKIETLEAKLERSFKDYEILEEQINFCEDYISEILEYSKTATKAKDIKEYIVNKYENLYIEL